MSMFSLRRSLFAVAMGGVLLGGCVSAAIQTPTLSATPSGEGGDYVTVYTDAEVRHTFHKEHYLQPLPTDVLALIVKLKKWCKVNNPIGGCPTDTPFARDWIQNELLKRSDQICNAYQTRLIHAFTVGGAGVQIVKGILQILLVPSAIAEATFQTASGGIFPAVSGEILQHAQFLAVNRRIYDKREAERLAILERQRTGLVGTPPLAYSLSRAVYDAEVYHSYCNYAVQWAAGEPLPKAAGQ